MSSRALFAPRGSGTCTRCELAISVLRNSERFQQIAPRIYLAACLLGVLGMLLGDMVARFAGLPRPQRRMVAFETGIQNSPLCFAILVTAFPAADQFELLELPLLYALFVLVEASLVTTAYHWIDSRKLARDPSAALPQA